MENAYALYYEAYARALTVMGNLLSMNASASAEASGTAGKSMATSMFAAVYAPFIEEYGNMISASGQLYANIADLLTAI